MADIAGLPDQVPVPCAGAVVHDESGRLLLVRRAHEPGAGQWSVPGGRIEPGESARQAAVREVREETGLSVRVARELGRVRRAGPGDTVYVIDDFACQVRTAAGQQASAVPLSAGDDALAVGWFTHRQLARLPLVAGLWQALAEWDVLPARG